MTDRLEIRESAEGDLDAIESLYLAAFPDENLIPLVRDLLPDASVTLSLVGVTNSQIAGHAMFTKCGVVGSNIRAALLGPIAVAPARQRQGIGSSIVRNGLRQLECMGVNMVFVLGDPAYYQRLGFVPESLIEPPYHLPAQWDGAWQSQPLGHMAASCAGKLSVPRQWRQPDLWAP